jgi:hypothetical protein
MAWRTPPPAPRVAGRPLPAKEEAISYSARQTRWLLTKPQATLSAREAVYLTTLQQVCPEVGQVQRLLTTFHSLIAARACACLDGWLEQCEHSGIAEFVRFAQGSVVMTRRCAPPCAIPGAKGPSKDRLIGLSCSSARCMVGQDLRCCVNACWPSLPFLPDAHQPCSTKSAQDPHLREQVTP